MIDSYSEDKYKSTIKSFSDLLSKFLEFVEYEENIANGLLGLAYILFSENIPFAFKDGIIDINDISIKETSERGCPELLASVGNETFIGSPYSIYMFIKKRAN